MVTSELDMCRICRERGDEDAPLFYPCKCKGSVRYIHSSCLTQWLEASKRNYCDLCRQRFKFLEVYKEGPTNMKTSLGRIATTCCLLIKSAVSVMVFMMVAWSWLGFFPWLLGVFGQFLFDQELIINMFADFFKDPTQLNSIVYIALFGIAYGYLYVTICLCFLLGALCMINVLVSVDEPKWLNQVKNQVLKRLTFEIDPAYRNALLADVSINMDDRDMFTSLKEVLKPLFFIAPNRRYHMEIPFLYRFADRLEYYDERVIHVLKSVVFQRVYYLRFFQARVIEFLLNLNRIAIPYESVNLYKNEYMKIDATPDQVESGSVYITKLKDSKPQPNFNQPLDAEQPEQNPQNNATDGNDNARTDGDDNDGNDRDRGITNLLYVCMDFSLHIVEAVGEFDMHRFFGFDNPIIYIYNFFKLFGIFVLIMEFTVILPAKFTTLIMEAVHFYMAYGGIFDITRLGQFSSIPTLRLNNGPVDYLIMLTIYYVFFSIFFKTAEIIFKSMRKYVAAFVCGIIYRIVKLMSSIIFQVFTLPIISGAVTSIFIHFFVDESYPMSSSRFFQPRFLIVEWWLLGIICFLCIMSIVAHIKKIIRGGFQMMSIIEKNISLSAIEDILHSNPLTYVMDTLAVFLAYSTLTVFYLFMPIYLTNMAFNKWITPSSTSSSSSSEDAIMYIKFYEQFLIEFFYAFFVAINIIRSVETSKFLLYVLEKIITPLSIIFDLQSFVLGETEFVLGRSYMTYAGIKQYNGQNDPYFSSKKFTPYEIQPDMDLRVLLFTTCFCMISFYLVTGGLIFAVLCGKLVLLVTLFDSSSCYICFSAGVIFLHAASFLYSNFGGLISISKFQLPRSTTVISGIPMKLKQWFFVYFVNLFVFPCVVGELLQYWTLVGLGYNIQTDLITSICQSMVIGITVTNLTRAVLLVVPDNIINVAPPIIRLYVSNDVSSYDLGRRFCVPIIGSILLYLVAPFCFFSSVLHAFNLNESAVRKCQFIVCMTPLVFTVFGCCAFLIKQAWNYIYQLHLSENYLVEKILLNSDKTTPREFKIRSSSTDRLPPALEVA